MGRTDPKVRILGVPLTASSDELWFHSSLFSIIRWIIVLLSLMYLLLTLGVIGTTECLERGSSQSNMNIVFAAGIFVTFFMTNTMYLVIGHISRQGDLFDHEARKHISIPIVALLFFYFLLFAVNCFGIYMLAIWDDSSSEQADACSEIKALSIVCIIVGFLDLISFWLISRTIVLRKRDESKLRHLNEFERISWEWEHRFRIWCNTGALLTCGMIGSVKSEESDHAFDQAGEIFGRWFTGHNMTLTDFIASLLLLRVEQKRRKKLQLERAWNDNSHTFALDVREQRLSDDLNSFLWGEEEEDQISKTDESRSSEKSHQTIKDVQKAKRKTGVKIPKFEIKKSAEILSTNKENVEMFKFIRAYLPHMLAIYGWKLLIYMDTIELRPFKSVTNLFRMPSIWDEKRFVSESDNCFKCAGSTLLKQTNLNPEDIIYASFANVEGQKIPYAVMVDHDLKSVVVACRGTHSLPDIITDFMIEPVSLISSGREWGFDGDGHHAHKGFFLAAQTIRRRLHANKALHVLLGVTPSPTVGTSQNPTEEPEEIDIKLKKKGIPNCAGYDLVLVGHSLGGGVASILGLMLRSEFPNLRCIAYSAPGCVFDTELAEKCKSWVVSPYVGKDFVSNLSWYSLQRLRGQTLDMLRRSKTNKSKIFSTLYKTVDAKDLLYDADEIPDTPERNEITEQIRELANESRSRVDNVVMHNPGKIIHFAKVSATANGKFKKKTRDYSATMVDNYDMGELEISTRMLLDHFPNYVAFIIEQVGREYIPGEK